MAGRDLLSLPPLGRDLLGLTGDRERGLSVEQIHALRRREGRLGSDPDTEEAERSRQRNIPRWTSDYEHEQEIERQNRGFFDEQSRLSRATADEIMEPVREAIRPSGRDLLGESMGDPRAERELREVVGGALQMRDAQRPSIVDEATARGDPYTASPFAEGYWERARERGFSPEPGRDSAAQVFVKFAQNLDDRLGRVVGGIIQSVPELASSLTGPRLDVRDLMVRQMVAEGANESDARAMLETGTEQWFRETGEGVFDRATRELQRNDPNAGALARFSYDAANAIADVLAAGAVTYATRSPAAGASLIGAQVFGDRFGKSISQGRSPEQAFRDGIFYAIPEYVGERIVIGSLMRPGGTFVGRLARGGVAEGVQEMTTEALQTAYDAGIIGEEMTVEEAFHRIIYAGAVGSVAGGALGAISGPAARRVGRSEAPIDIEITPQDEASPLETGLIAEGKASIEQVLREADSDRALEGTIGRETGDRVTISIGGETRTGTVKDSFVEQDDELGAQDGVVVEWDGGGETRARIADLNDAGARIDRPGRDLLAREPRESERNVAPQGRQSEAGAFERQWAAIIRNEGGTGPNGEFLTSPAGAIGPAQVMPGTAPEAARLAGLPYDERRYRTDAEYNIALGRAYYREQLRTFRDPAMAAAAYNAGPGRVRQAIARARRDGGSWENYLPAETRAYVENFRERSGNAAGVMADYETGEALQPDYSWIEEGVESPGLDQEQAAPEREADLTGSAASFEGQAEVRRATAALVDPIGIAADRYRQEAATVVPNVAPEIVEAIRARVSATKPGDSVQIERSEADAFRAAGARIDETNFLPRAYTDALRGDSTRATRVRVGDLARFGVHTGGTEARANVEIDQERAAVNEELRRSIENEGIREPTEEDKGIVLRIDEDRGLAWLANGNHRAAIANDVNPDMQVPVRIERLRGLKRAYPAAQPYSGEFDQVARAEPRAEIAVERSSVVIRNATEADRARINAALPDRVTVLPRSDGTFIAPKKYEETIRTALTGDGTRTAPVKVSTADDIRRAETKADPEPTPAQAEAGNYSHGHLSLHGLDIAVETPKGAMRRGVDTDDQPWENESPAAYGRIKATTGGDGEQIDVYVGDNPQSERVFVVDQHDPETGRFDETKTVLGVDSREEALAIYDGGFSDGSGPQRRRGVTEMSVPEFREWVASDASTGPAAEAATPQPSDEIGQSNAPREIGKNSDGWPMFEQPDGSRYYLKHGQNFGRNVEKFPPQGDDKLDRDFDFLTVEEVGKKAERFNPSPYIDKLKSYVDQRGRSLKIERVSKHLDLSPLLSQRVIGAFAAQPNSGLFVSKRSGAIRRIPRREGPVSLYHFLRDRGGILDNKEKGNGSRHALARGRNLTRYPGLINREGMPLDDALEAAVEAGYFPTTDRQAYSVDDLLQKLENASREYRPGERPEPGAADSREAADAGVRATIEAFDLNLTDAEMAAAVDYAVEGDAPIQAITKATVDRADELFGEMDDALEKQEYGETDEDGQQDQEAAEGVARPEAPEGAAERERAVDAEPDAARPEEASDGVESRAGVGGTGDVTSPAAANATGPQPEQIDAFGLQPGDQRRALERKGEGRSKSDAKQKAPGEDGGLFDLRDTTRDIEEVTQPESNPIAEAKAALRQAMAALETADSRKPAMIEDAGEKIGGARKDKWAERGMNLGDLEGMSQGEAFQLVNKDAVWPKPDYEAMVAAGLPADVAAGVKVLRDGLSTKPRTDSNEGRRDFIEMMGAARGILESARTIEDLKGAQDRLYEAAGIVPGERYSLDRSEERKVASRRLFSIMKGSYAKFSLGYNERQKIAKMVEDGFPAKVEPWTRRYAVREYNRLDPPWRVTFKTKRGFASEEGFASREEAEAAAKAIYEGEDRSRDRQPERPHLDEIERTGADVRGGRNIDSTDFIKDFGFRGVEFGNWVASDERRTSVNMAFEALHDLAEVIGVPPRALSLNGQLGLAFGARGKGRAAAHYEPGKLVINLTKMSGAGSLAHEWGHALDHYFGTLNTDAGTRGAPKGASGWYDRTSSRVAALSNLRPEMAQAFDNLMTALFQRQRSRAEMIRELELNIEKAQGGVETQRERLVKARDSETSGSSAFAKREYAKIIKGIEEWVAATERRILFLGEKLATAKDETKPLDAGKVESSFYRNAKALSGKQGEKGYWARPTEMLARSFESYVFDRIAERGDVSEYLVQGVEESRYGEDYAGNPYPTGEERTAINAAYGALFDAMEVNEGEGFSLYSRGPEVDRREFLKGATAVAGGFMMGDRLFAQPPGLTSILERSMNEVVPLAEALESVAQNSENPQFRRFARRMIPLVRGIVIRGAEQGQTVHADGTPVPEDISLGLAHGMHQTDETTDGDVIWLAKGELVNGFNEGTLIHESLHAALYRMFGRVSVRMADNDPVLLRREGFNREAVPRPASAADLKALRDIYSDAVGAFEDMVEGLSAAENRSDRVRHIRNALANPDEMLSWALENPNVQAFLREQPSRADPEKSLWDRIVDLIARALGIGGDSRTILDDILDASYRLLGDPAGPVRVQNRFNGPQTAAEINRGSETGQSRYQRLTDGDDPVFYSALERAIKARTPPSEQSTRLESVTGSIAGNAKFLRDTAETEAFRAEGLSGFDVPTQTTVLHEVFVAAQDNKIFDAIVRLVPVDVVDILAREQLTPEAVLHDEAVLQALPSIYADDSIAEPVDVASAFVEAAATAITEEIAATVDEKGSLLDFGAAEGTIDDRQDDTPSSDVELGAGEVRASSAPKDIADRPLFSQLPVLRGRPVSDAQAAEIATQLGRELERLGISDRIALKAANGLLTKEGAQGSYFRRAIQVSLDMAINPRATLNHEAIHAMRNLGLFTQSEWTALKKAAWSDKGVKAFVEKGYADDTARIRDEEAVAELYSRWRTDRMEAKGFAEKALIRMGDFLNALARAFGVVMGRQPNAGAVMRDIERGRIGRRETGEGVFAEDLRDQGPLFQQRPDPELWNDMLNRVRTLTGAAKTPGKRDDIAMAWDRLRTNFQDRMLPIMRTQTAIEKVIGRELSEEERPYRQEALYTGRVGAQFEQLEDQFVQPMFEAMSEEGVSTDELESYLYARHAPERNAKLKKEGVDDGSGMTDIEAAAILARIDKAGKRESLERVTAFFDKMNAFALDARVESGLMSAEDAKSWRETFPNYAPLRGHLEVPEDERPNVGGKGYTVRGPESRRAFGRKSKADDILAHAIMQAEEAIVRSEKNRVATDLYNLAKANPDPNFWQVQKVSMKKRINKETGLVETYPVTVLLPEDAPFTVSLKVGGKAQRVTFNKGNPAAFRAASAMRRLNEPEIAVRALQVINQWLSKANTTLNPDFIWKNAFRDLETATANLSEFDIKGLRRDVFASYRKALFAAERGAFKRPGDTEWDQAWAEFTAEGGRVFYNQVDDVGELRKQIEKRFAKLTRERQNLSPKQWGMDLWGGLKWTFDKIEKANLGVENAVRLSAYKNLRDRGVTKKQAAFIAKELTVNFNRRGVYGVLMNSLYLFMNATTQGQARMVMALRHRRTQKIAVAMVVTGALNSLFNVLASGVDDDDELYYDQISDYEKSTNLIFMLPGSSQYLKIPVAYGYNIFFEAGRRFVDVGRGRTSTLEAGYGWLFTALNSFNPIGGQESLANFLAPTLADPAVDLVVDNRDYADRPIMPDLMPFDRSPPPDSQRFWPSVNPMFRQLTDALNRGTGGDDVRPGWIDISPESLEYLTQYATGAAGATITRIQGAVTKSLDGDPTTALEINDIPIARTMVGTQPSWYARAAFYARLEHVEEVVGQARQYRSDQNREGLESIREDEADVLRVSGAARAARREMRDLRKKRSQLSIAVERDRITDERADALLLRLQEREERLFDRFSSIYLETVENPRHPDR